MKISYSWLKEYMDLKESPEVVGDILTATGLEVEKTEKLEALPNGLQGVVIGEVMTCEAHPGADRLKLATVDIGGSEASKIVCGAPNVEVGQKVLVATVGCTLFPTGGDPFKIKKSRIRGEESNGMICASDELGLGTDHSGILVLDTTLANGTPAANYFNQEDDYIFEIGLTPNRGDATGHIGVARDLKAVLGHEVNWPSVDKFKPGNSRNVEVEVQNTTDCPRYSGVTITGIKVAESPDWLRKRLLSIGLNPINNVVDITNFVLHETGQPLHAFDADKIKGNKIIVGNLKDQTAFKTLDEVERKLSSEDLMICNAEGGMCIAGVFGGIESGVTESTTAIFLESAYFSPDAIRKTAQRHVLKTDASFRFERGTDPSKTVYAMKRAALLISEITGGQVSSPVVDIYPVQVDSSTVSIEYAHIDRLTGIEIPRDRIHAILNRLDIQTINRTEAKFDAIVPAYRSDVTREADVIEEILRIYGFNNIEIPATVGADYLADFPENDPYLIQKVISDLLTGVGFFETMTNSLTRPIYAEKDLTLDANESVEIINKLSEDLGVMRQRMLHSLLEAASYNISHRQRDLKLFEFGKSYHKKGSYKERKWLALLITGDYAIPNWNSPAISSGFYDLGDLILRIISRVTVKEVETEVIGDGVMQYGLNYTIDGKSVARAGLVNPGIARINEIKQDVYYGEIDWAALVKKATTKLSYIEVPKYPEVKRDLSLVLKKHINFNEVKSVAQKNSNHLLKKMNVFDVYEGDKIGKEEKAYAISFILQDPTKTLTDKIIDKTMSKLMNAFEAELEAVIRK